MKEYLFIDLDLLEKTENTDYGATSNMIDIELYRELIRETKDKKIPQDISKKTEVKTSNYPQSAEIYDISKLLSSKNPILERLEERGLEEPLDYHASANDENETSKSLLNQPNHIEENKYS